MVKKTFILIIICSGVFYLYSQNKNSVEEMFSPPERMPIMKDLCRFVLDNTEYPQSAINDTISGDILIDFYVETNGNTSNHRVIKGVREDLNNEALRVAKLLKFDKPAYTRGKAVRTIYLLSISFLLNYDYLHSRHTPIIRCSDILNEDYLMPQECKTVNNDSIEIIFAVETQPEFNKESTIGLAKFIDENVREVNVPEGNSRVVVQFLVDTLGYTTCHKIIRDVNPELDNEALRVSRLLKFMKPATQCGKPVNCNSTLTFDFKKYSFNNKKKARKKRPLSGTSYSLCPKQQQF